MDPPLPPGWAVEMDPATGQPVYVNALTGETSSTRPTPLPPGWEVRNDPATGKPIYVNTATGETLTDDAGDAVMMEGERPLMAAHADLMGGHFPHPACDAGCDYSAECEQRGHYTGFTLESRDSLPTHGNTLDLLAISCRPFIPLQATRIRMCAQG